jgi:Kef-type K+ transport system membrane component KefB
MELSPFELTLFFSAVGFILILTRFLAQIGRRFKIPTIIIELLAGIILGPTFLGIFFPEVFGLFFPREGGLSGAYDTLFNLSIVMLLFLVGMDLDLNLLKRQRKIIISTSLFAVLIPLIAGILFAWAFFDFLYGIEISAAPFIFPLVFGTIMAISSLPIITGILVVHNVVNTPVGVTILGTALVTDVVVWFLFSSLLVYVNASESNIQILYTLLYIVVFLFIVFILSGRKEIAGKLFTQNIKVESTIPYDLSLILGICLLTAAFTNSIHLHSGIGAFIAGMVCRRLIGENTTLHKQFESFILNFFAPIFFISIGLKLNFVTHFNLWMVLAVFAFACISKLIAAYIGARLGEAAKKPAAAIAFGLNARGAMGIIIAAIALKIQLIGPQLFEAIIITAIGTSFLAEYALVKILKLNENPVPEPSA